MSYLAREFDHAPPEQTVLGACLNNGQILDEVLSQISTTDLIEPIHVKIFSVLAKLRSDGRTPSEQSVLLHLGNVDVLPDLSLQSYLNRLFLHFAQGSSYKDALEIIREQSFRRQLGVIGTELLDASVACSDTICEIGGRAVSSLDDVLAAHRMGKSQRYHLGMAAKAALTQLTAEDRRNPTTGLTELDRMTGGLPRGQSTIIAGRPGMGKSTAGTMFLRRCGTAGLNCLAFSLEMGAEQLGARLLTDAAYTQAAPIYYEDFEQKRIDERSKERLQAAAELIEKLPVVIEEQRGLTVAELCARTRKHHARLQADGKSLDVVVIDHISIVRASSRYAGNHEREMAEISGALATLAKDLDVAVVALCQLNRGVEGRENKRPSLSDLRASGAIEEDASLVCFVFRPAYYLGILTCDDPADEARRVALLADCKHKLEFIVAKNRNGRCGTVEAFCDIGASAIRSKTFGRPI